MALIAPSLGLSAWRRFEEERIRMTIRLADRAKPLIEAAAGKDDDELLSTNQVAAWLGVSTQWLEIGRSTGRHGPKFIRIGERRIRYRRGDVIKFINANRHQNTDEYAGAKP
jgi:predicted DNA-binding transcriptional regulator AlpA